MLISHRHRFIFVHNCKAAGTSIREALAPYSSFPERYFWNRVKRRLGVPVVLPYADVPAHATACQIRSAVGADLFASYFTFAFVRNPWDWQVSWYHYLLRHPDHPEHAPVRALRGFTEYIEWRTARDVLLQKHFVTDASGRVIVNFIGCFERLRADFGKVCERIGARALLPHLNGSRRGDYRAYYNRRTRALVGAAFREDVEFFDYRFEGGAGRRVAAPRRLALARP
jgi:hypothetical protein